jgi:hypothetical protein
MPTKTFSQAIGSGDVDEIKLHIAQNPDIINRPDANRNTPLGNAIESGRVEIVTLLLEAGANVAAPSRDMPPVVMAAVRGNTDMVKALVAHGASVDAADSMGMTPLIAAAQSGYIDIAEFLITSGANVNAKDKTGRTPLTIATMARQTELATLLRQNGAEEPVNAFDRGPYGSRGLRTPTGSMASLDSGASDDYQMANVATPVLADPNEILARVAAFPGLSQSIAALDVNSTSEQRNWRQRRMDNRTMLIRAVEKQFEEEMTFAKQMAQTEKAVKTVTAIDDLTAKRKARYAVISDDLREERRLAMLEEREASARTRSTGRSRGRTSMTEPMAGGLANDPYAATSSRPAPRTRPAQDVNEPALDPVTEDQAQAWLSADPLDKRDLLTKVHELDLREYDALRQTAVEEQAQKTAAAIEGLMLARQNRLTSIQAKMIEEDERLQRLEERMGTTTTMTPGATRGRGARGGATGGDTTTTRRGRRY